MCRSHSEFNKPGKLLQQNTKGKNTNTILSFQRWWICTKCLKRTIYILPRPSGIFFGFWRRLIHTKTFPLKRRRKRHTSFYFRGSGQGIKGSSKIIWMQRPHKFPTRPTFSSSVSQFMKEVRRRPGPCNEPITMCSQQSSAPFSKQIGKGRNSFPPLGHGDIKQLKLPLLQACATSRTT